MIRKYFATVEITLTRRRYVIKYFSLYSVNVQCKSFAKLTFTTTHASQYYHQVGWDSGWLRSAEGAADPPRPVRREERRSEEKREEKGREEKGREEKRRGEKRREAKRGEAKRGEGERKEMRRDAKRCEEKRRDV